jgi:transposase
LRSRGKKEAQHGEGLGRSRGGFTTKLHIRANAAGLPLGFAVTPGEAHDSTAYLVLMDEDAPEPRALIADRGYDADAIRCDLEARGSTPVIPTKRNRKVQISVDAAVYALRNCIERAIGRLKNARRVATRYDKTATSYLGFVQLAAIRFWLRHLDNTDQRERSKRPPSKTNRPPMRASI